jgi:hypothetical protein
MERNISNLHLTNTLRTRANVFGAGVFGAGVSALRVLVAASTSSSAVSSLLTAVPMVWGTSESRYIMT